MQDVWVDAVRPRSAWLARAALVSWRVCLGCTVTALVWLLVLPLVARAEWTLPGRLSETGSNAQIVEDGRGDTLAAWQECRSGCKEDVVVADYLPAGASSRQPPIQISTGEGYLAQIAADPSGDDFAVFDSHAGIQGAVHPVALGAWQPSTLVGPRTGAYYEPNDARLAIDAAGDAVVVWQQGYVIEAAFRPAATGRWEAPVAISVPGEHASEPQVAIGEGGEVAAVWSVYEPETVPCSAPSSVPCVVIVKGKDSVKAAFRPARAVWQAPVTLASAESVGEPQVSLDGTGNTTALWRASSGGHRTIESSLRPAGGGWLVPVTISLTPLPYLANELDTSLQLAVDAQGDVTAAWVHQYANATDGISGVAAVETAVRGAHGSWHAPSVISGSEGFDGGVRLAENASGTAAAVWSCSARGGHYPLTVRGAIRPTTGGQWQSAVDISAAEGGFPDVALGPDGKAVAIWDEGGPFTSQAPPAGIYTSMYEAELSTPGVPQSGCPDSSPPAVSAPVLSRVRMTHRRFRVGKQATAISAKKTPLGTSFRFTLSTAAKLRITITSTAAGLRDGHRCLAPSASLKRAHAKRCTRTITVSTLTRASEPQGADSVAFSGRTGQRALSPRSYKAVLSANNTAGHSKPVKLSFTVVH
jgi:hypothetical protein